MAVKDFMSQLWEALAITILLAEIDCKPLIAVTENDLVNTPENSQLTFIFFYYKWMICKLNLNLEEIWGCRLALPII